MRTVLNERWRSSERTRKREMETYRLRGLLEIGVARELGVVLRLLHGAQLHLAVAALQRQARHRSICVRLALSNFDSVCLCVCSE